MNCDEVRDELVASGESPAVARHLIDCAECARFAQRLAATRAALEARRLEIHPDPAFAARVLARLPDGTQLLGWAAFRLLPAALALAVGLAWYSLFLLPAPTDVVLTDPGSEVALIYSVLAGGAP